MKERGELFHDPDAPEVDTLDARFWANATIEQRSPPRSVHLKLDPDVFAYFYAETGGKGHISRMQAVLKAYVAARKKA
jgi:uncharacterized protein (DUF4415 family)